MMPSYDEAIELEAKRGAEGYYDDLGEPRPPLPPEVIALAKELGRVLGPGFKPFWDGNGIGFFANKSHHYKNFYADIGADKDGCSGYVVMDKAEWSFGSLEPSQIDPELLAALRQALS